MVQILTSLLDVCAPDDVLVRMMDDRSAEQSRNLSGHSGPVHAVSFSPDRTLLLSCSEDGTSEYGTSANGGDANRPETRKLGMPICG